MDVDREEFGNRLNEAVDLIENYTGMKRMDIYQQLGRAVDKTAAAVPYWITGNIPKKPVLRLLIHAIVDMGGSNDEWPILLRKILTASGRFTSRIPL